MKILSSRNGIAILLLLVAIGLFANLFVQLNRSYSPTAIAQVPTDPGRVNVVPLMNANTTGACAAAGDTTCSLFVLIDPGHIVFPYSRSGINFCYMAVPAGSTTYGDLEVRCSDNAQMVSYDR